VNLLEKNSNLSDEQKEIVRDIKTSSELVNTIIGDILDCSKIESGKFQFELIPFDLLETLETISRVQERLLKRKPIQWNCIMKDNTPQFVIGDPTRLQQIINNLLTNAEKFTNPGGTVTLKVDC